jgi:hypothetical protein
MVFAPHSPVRGTGVQDSPIQFVPSSLPHNSNTDSDEVHGGSVFVNLRSLYWNSLPILMSQKSVSRTHLRNESPVLPAVWAEIVWSMQNLLLNTVHPSDHLESLLFSHGLVLKLALFWLLPLLRVDFLTHPLPVAVSGAAFASFGGGGGCVSAGGGGGEAARCCRCHCCVRRWATRWYSRALQTPPPPPPRPPVVCP